MLFGRQGDALISEPPWNNRAASARIRLRPRARSAMTYNPRELVPSLFAAMAWPRRGPPPLSIWYWRYQSGAPLASRPRHHGPLAFRDRRQSGRSSLLLRPLLSKPSRSLWSLRRFFDRGPHHHERTVRARDRAADQNHFFGLAHLHHLQVLHGYALITEMPRHSHILPNATRRGTIAYGAVSP